MLFFETLYTSVREDAYTVMRSEFVRSFSVDSSLQQCLFPLFILGFLLCHLIIVVNDSRERIQGCQDLAYLGKGSHQYDFIEAHVSFKYRRERTLNGGCSLSGSHCIQVTLNRCLLASASGVECVHPG